MSATQEAINACLALTGAFERGWSDRPADKGGPTNNGITLPVLTQYLGRPASVAELQALTTQQSLDIFAKLFIVAPGFDSIEDPSLLELVVDCAVNHGSMRPATWLQQAAGMPLAQQDGHFGPMSQAAIAALSPASVYRKVLAARARFYGQIVSHDQSQAQFDGGWMERLAHFIEATP